MSEEMDQITQLRKSKFGRPRAAEAWLREIVNAETDECIEYPFQKNGHGYGMFVSTVGRSSRKKHRAHIFVCELAHCPCPPGKDRVAHSCDNRPCVNKRHLRWADAKENTNDMVERGRHYHGERHAASKLDDAKVREIRRRAAAGEQQKDIAAVFGVARSVVCEVVARKAWRHV